MPGVWGRPRASRTGPCPGCGADPGLHGPAVTRDPGGGAGANQKCPQNDEIVPKMAQNRVLGPSALTGATLRVKDRPAHTHTRRGAGVSADSFRKNTTKTAPCPTTPGLSHHGGARPPRAHPGLHARPVAPPPGRTPGFTRPPRCPTPGSAVKPGVCPTPPPPRGDVAPHMTLERALERPRRGTVYFSLPYTTTHKPVRETR